MTRNQTQVFEILQDIPDDKLSAAIEILKGLRALYRLPEADTVQENASADIHGGAFGILHKYANPDLIPLEKEAWGMAVREKYAVD
ncbi:MAG: hypothetical protein FWH20_01165 [Oscillospiraceae bacterium]|nr:hypothetical protein [Oscillospiraceae bacterium]